MRDPQIEFRRGFLYEQVMRCYSGSSDGKAGRSTDREFLIRKVGWGRQFLPREPKGMFMRFIVCQISFLNLTFQSQRCLIRSGNEFENAVRLFDVPQPFWRERLARLQSAMSVTDMLLWWNSDCLKMSG